MIRLFRVIDPTATGKDVRWDLCTLRTLKEANRDDQDMIAEVAALQPGQTYKGGGGAVPEFAIQYVGNYDPEAF